MFRIGFKSRRFLNHAWQRALSVRLSPNFSSKLGVADIRASGKFSVIVPIHDSPEVVSRCLRSLVQNGADAEIILVDDASKQDRTIQLLNEAACANGWILIRNETALGHSAATQVGIDRATRPFLCLLNSDTVIPPNLWEPIDSAFADDPAIAMVGPATCHCYSEQCLEVIKERRFAWTNEEVYHFAVRNRLLWKLLKCVAPRDRIISRVGHLSGFALFIPRRIWDEVGGFDKRFKDYFNETELCYRLIKKGYRIVWTKEAYVHHLAEQSYGNSVNEKKKEAERMFLEIHGQY